MKYPIRFCLINILLFICFSIMTLNVLAEDIQDDLAEVMVVNTSTVIKKDKVYNAENLFELEKGMTVVRFSDDGNWSYIHYKDYDGYTRSMFLDKLQDMYEVEQEFEQINIIAENSYEQVEKLQKERLRNIIYFVAIIIAVAVGVIVFIAATIIKKKEEKQQEEDGNGECTGENN